MKRVNIIAVNFRSGHERVVSHFTTEEPDLGQVQMMALDAVEVTINSVPKGRENREWFKYEIRDVSKLRSVA